MLGESFNQFMVESYLSSTSIGGGLNVVRKCRAHDKGSFYSSFFQLSIGIERFFKIIFILNHMIENNLEKPDFRTLKNSAIILRSFIKTVQAMVPAIYPIWSGN